MFPEPSALLQVIHWMNCQFRFVRLHKCSIIVLFHTFILAVFFLIVVLMIPVFTQTI